MKIDNSLIKRGSDSLMSVPGYSLGRAVREAVTALAPAGAKKSDIKHVTEVYLQSLASEALSIERVAARH